MSDDGAHAIVVIALLGNPFSPAYARARAAGARLQALDFCALNVGVYARDRSAWALHERPIATSDRGPASLCIGTSTMRWDGDALVVDIDERSAPFGGRVRGTVTLHPAALGPDARALDGGGLHTWWPIAPRGRIEVALDEPGLRFAGHGYLDANAGDVPLEATFARWTWSRATIDGRRTAITYDVVERSGSERSFAIAIDAQREEVEALPGLRDAPLPRTRWRLDRSARTEDRGAPPRIARELEDTPFYARALVETRLGGASVVAVHEELSLERLERGWVRFLLPFRMRRG